VQSNHTAIGGTLSASNMAFDLIVDLVQLHLTRNTKQLLAACGISPVLKAGWLTALAVQCDASTRTGTR
jgi:hypothetical protein